MIRKFCVGCVLGLVFAGSVGSASALGLLNPFGSSVNTRPDAIDVSFFGRPYPYGYTGWGPCVRYEEVQTRWGWRLRKVRVCR
jgi:hypothetical protein